MGAIRGERHRKVSRTALCIAVAVALVAVLCAADFPDFARPTPDPARVELAQGWTLASARAVPEDGAALSTAGYADTGWHSVTRMPATVLQALQQDGTYPDLYVGTKLRDDVPADLYEQDWWYRTTFAAPPGHATYLLDFPGISYRAEVWLNGHRIADSTRIVGMHTAHQIDATPWINQGAANTLAVKVTPERSLQDVDGVELADSWYDWINWRHLGYRSPTGAVNNSFVADRNAGIWKPVYLRMSEGVVLEPAAVTTELPLPRTDSALLTVYTGVRNHSAEVVRGIVRATITRPGKPDIAVDKRVTLAAGEEREIVLGPDEFPELRVEHPDLWWPYTLGEPALYGLRTEFRRYNRAADVAELRFGIRDVSQHRDTDTSHPELGTGGNFYLTVNGRNFPVRGAAYAPDLLFADDPERDIATLRYAKDLGLNMLRLEGKFPGERLVDMADELGIPLMFGWMCCNQWEKWAQWDAEDNRVARDSLSSQIRMLRSHASAFVWANGSDGRPPPAVLDDYHRLLGAAALAERRRRHRLQLHQRLSGRTGLGRDSDGRAVQLATSELLVRRTVRTGAGRHRRAGRQRTHPAPGEPARVPSARQALAHQRRLVLPCGRQQQQRGADHDPSGDRPALRDLQQCRDVHPQSPTRAL